MTTFGIVRHGETDWNAQRRIQGRTDIPLNETGRAQAAATGAALHAAQSEHGNWDAIVSSPLSRAHETAQIIAATLGLAGPELVPALAERAHGEIEGLSFAERSERFPDGSEVPGLETRDEVLDRTLPSLEELAARYPGGRVLIVSHGGVISTLMHHSSGGEIDGPGRMIQNGSVQEFRWGLSGLSLRSV
ncbi:histidine phosphatase family protein [Microterricola viridarii]|uniref:Phosphoglycerate mutase n=1 Tax=Microterricola viridarii TaxID=412690 RepID=A0A0X8E2G4_9MICO|nr:histidine phosphatase family protein [Microterricola viridarii]AMB58477.1 hypothetical protein AWU67_05960 [Microterricola viridarii]